MSAHTATAESHSYDDPSANLWSTYLSKSEKHDRTLAQNWKGDMDSILIFAGLFSASLTAFLVESYKTLNPDPDTASAFFLGQLLMHQLASSSASNGSIMTHAPDPSILRQFDQSNFSPSAASIICNILWFLSLAFSLICALSATLVEQWTRQYLQASSSRPAPQDRARMSAYLHHGIKKYKLSAIVEAIPLLLHISLFLFFAGLVAFLSAVNSALQYVILVVLVICILLYLAVTVLPVFDLACPYWTPLSGRSWALFHKLGLLSRLDADGNEHPAPPEMAKARELDAIEITPERNERDLKSMCWTLSGLRKDAEIEPFVAILPSVVAGFDYSAKWLIDRLMRHADVSVRLAHRIPGLLATCTAQVLEPAKAQKRAATCLKAMWSLTMLSIPDPAGAAKSTLRSSLIFKEDSFDFIARVVSAVPSVEHYAGSASVVIARSLLDMYVDRAAALENDLAVLMETGRLPEAWNGTKLYEIMDIIAIDGLDALFENSRSRIQAVTEPELAALKSLKRPYPYVILEGLVFHLTRLVDIAAVPHPAFGIDVKRILDAIECVNAFQEIVNQAGLNLSLQYIESILQAELLPHEAFNTLRRTFFRIDFSVKPNKQSETGVNQPLQTVAFSRESQERLVRYLEESVEPSALNTTRLPHSVIGIMLNLTGRALSDPTLVQKAISIIEDYAKFYTNDSAPKALQNLRRSLPGGAQMSRPLDLFSSHVSADARPERALTKSRTNTLASSIIT